MSDSEKIHRIHVTISESELKAVDDWGFGHRIRARAETIRRLISIGMKVDDLLDLLQDVMDDFDRVITLIDYDEPRGKEEHQNFADILRKTGEARDLIERIVDESPEAGPDRRPSR